MYANTPIYSRTWQFALVLILVLAGLAPSTENVRADDTRVINPTLPATFAWPTWWVDESSNPSPCDEYYYNAEKNPGDGVAALLSSSPESSWRGIQACGPRPQTQDGHDVLVNFGAGNDQFMFQCTELAKRYLYVAYGANPITASGSQVAYNYSHSSTNGYPDKFQYFVNDGSKPIFPQEGDVVSMISSDSAGHVAIVTALYVSNTMPGDGYIMLMDQNGSPSGSFRLDIEDYVVQPETEQDLGYEPTDWIHPLVGIENSPSTTVTTDIYGVASENNHAWIVGDEQPLGYSMRTVTWYWNGSSWMKFSPPSQQGNYSHHVLRDVAINPNGDVYPDVYTVGDYYTGQTKKRTLVFKWNVSQQRWDRITSDYDTGTDYNQFLNTVGFAGPNGDIYAAGHSIYQSPFRYKPLLLKWNGTKFENQNLAYPPGVTSASITDMSFSSSNNGWMVGSMNGYAYHFDGSSWNAEALPTGVTGFTDVVAVSDTEAWALYGVNLGGYVHPQLFHYTTGNGWVQDTSFSFPAGQSVELNGISAEGRDNVWAVGIKPPQPYLLHYDGTTWTHVSAQTFSTKTVLRDVSVTNGFIWAAGDRQQYTYPLKPTWPVVLVK